MENENNAKQGASPKRAVIIYSVALFVVVVIFIAISYLMNERGQDTVEALNAQQTTALQRIDTLRSENERLQSELEKERERASELEEELRQAHIDWGEDAKRLEDKYKTEFNDLLRVYNELLAQVAAAAAEEETE